MGHPAHPRPGGHAGTLAATAGLVIALVWSAPAGASVAPPWEETAMSRAAVPGEVLVRYRAGSSATTRHAARASARVDSASRLPLPGLELLEIGEGRSVRAAVRRLERRPGVLYAEPNYVRRFHEIPDDPLFDQLWGLHNTGAGRWVADADVDAPEAWDTTLGSQDVVVGLIDSGVNHQHPDLATKIWANPGETGAGRETNGVDDDGNGFVDDFRGWDFSRDDGTPEGDNDPMDVLGHGTHTGGTVAAAGDNGIGVVGVGRATALMPLKTGDFSVSAAQSVQAVRYADRMGADVVNMSFGGFRPSFAEQDAIKAADDVLFAISAGNEYSDNDERPVYPCNYAARNITCVAASTAGDTLAGFSNVGRHSVDLAAPGADILSTAWRRVLEPLLDEPFARPLRGRWRSEGPGEPVGDRKEAPQDQDPVPGPRADLHPPQRAVPTRRRGGTRTTRIRRSAARRLTSQAGRAASSATASRACSSGATTTCSSRDRRAPAGSRSPRTRAAWSEARARESRSPSSTARRASGCDSGSKATPAAGRTESRSTTCAWRAGRGTSG